MPDPARSTVAIPAPTGGPQRWAGAPCAVLDDDGAVLLAYRERAEGDALVLARSADGGTTFTEIGRLGPERAAASMLERPALVRHPGGWRLFVGFATPGTSHWWVGAFDAPSPADLLDAPVTRVLPGDDALGLKDPVVRRGVDGWQAWVCCHHLEVPGEEDRMSTGFATSRDGWDWTWHGTLLRGRPERWDARGTRVSTLLPGGLLAYDGRATKQENWFERTGMARPAIGGGWAADDRIPVVDVRYLEYLALPDGGERWFFESRTASGDHELRTQPVDRRVDGTSTVDSKETPGS